MLMFQRGSGGASFRSLREAADGLPLDDDALAARMLYAAPLAPGATVYRDVHVSESGPSDIGTVASPPPRRPAEAAAGIRSALRAAVDRALSGKSRVAVLTGGGTDSSALLALAVDWARRTGNTAFGVALDFQSEGDDRPFLVLLERALGCEVLRLRPEDGAAHMGATLGGVDGAPLTWPGAPMEIAMLVRAREHGADVALSGVGADELLDGKPQSLSDLARDGQLRDALAIASTLQGFVRPPRAALAWVARPIVASMVPRPLRRARAKLRRVRPLSWWGPRACAFQRAWFDLHLDRALSAEHDADARVLGHEAAPHREHVRFLSHQESHASRLARANPYLDRVFAETVLRLPPAWLLHGGSRRGLFREAMRGIVPDELRRRTSKASFEPAFARCLRASNVTSTLRTLTDGRELARRGLVEPSEFERAALAFVDGVQVDDGWATVWPALTVESFLRNLS